MILGDKLKALQESLNSHIFVLASIGLNFGKPPCLKYLTHGAPPPLYSEIILDFTPDAFLILFFIALTQNQPATLSSSVFKHLLSGILPTPTTIKQLLEWFEELRFAAKK